MLMNKKMSNILQYKILESHDSRFHHYDSFCVLDVVKQD
jgi:hypothetical protein